MQKKIRVRCNGRVHGTRVTDMAGRPVENVTGVYFSCDNKHGASLLLTLEYSGDEIDLKADVPDNGRRVVELKHAAGERPDIVWSRPPEGADG